MLSLERTQETWHSTRDSPFVPCRLVYWNLHLFRTHSSCADVQKIIVYPCYLDGVGKASMS